jgi:dienelactone hydrolase
MCYDADAIPPFFGSAMTAVDSTEPILTSADGARFATFLARPERPSGIGVLVLPDNRSLSGFYEQLALRLAEQRHTALAIDYFGRTAGVEHRARGADFSRMENLMGRLSALTKDGLYVDFTAAVDHLRAPEGGGCRDVVSLGFCLGGRFAFLTAAAGFRVDGVIGLYGYPDVLAGAPGPTQLGAELSAPTLGMFGGGDEGIPAHVVAAFDEALTAAGVEHEFVTYPGAPHGFFEQRSPEFADASADVWRRILEFLARSA